MRFERFIATRFLPRRGDGGFSAPLSSVAVAAIALGVVVMLLAVCVLRGFQNSIADKVAGFGSHITVMPFSSNPPYQEAPMAVDSALVQRLQTTPGVRHLQPFATKGGMVKTGGQIHGVILRGMTPDSDTSFFSSSLVEGHFPQLGGTGGGEVSNEVLVSRTLATKREVSPGNKLRTYFWHEGAPRARAFTISGIYNTDLREMDEVYIVGDLRVVQRLNGWGDSVAGGYELFLDDLGQRDNVAPRILEQLPYDLTMQTLVESRPALFSWLDLLNSNVTLILTIMCIVCAIAIVSALLIIIFEKQATIGILKALGATERSIRRIFLLKGSGIILRGILIGTLIAAALCLVQITWEPLRLDAESYSMTHVPIDLNPWTFLAVDLGTLALCLLALLLPTGYISRISPATTVRNEK